MSNGAVFSDIAGRYDRLNAMLSLGQDQKWRNAVVSRLPGGRLLDLGAGTGAANEIFGSRTIVALDPAPEMLAFNGASQRVVSVGERLPFEDASFDTIIESITSKLFTFSDDTIILPGHGVDSTIGTERPHLDEWIERGW